MMLQARPAGVAPPSVLQASALSSKAAAVHAPVVIRSTPRTLQRVAGAQRCGAARVSAAADAYAAVKITVQGRHMDVTEAMKQYAESKVAKAVSNFESAVKQVDVKLSAAGNHGKGAEAHHQREQTAEVTVYTLRHGVIRCEDTEDDLYAALDLVTDKLKRKMRRTKEKAVQRNTWPGRGGSKGGDTIQAHLDPDEEVAELPIDGVAAPPAPEIVREKILFLESALTPEEAVEQLEAVGHSFFVFKDAADGATKVVYRRRSHGYGLIIPQA